jgi:hypothetical protein
MFKLARFVELEGYCEFADLAQAMVCDTLSPAICMNEGCDYHTEMEPDQTRGYCEACGTNSMQSALVLGGLI